MHIIRITYNLSLKRYINKYHANVTSKHIISIIIIKSCTLYKRIKYMDKILEKEEEEKKWFSDRVEIYSTLEIFEYWKNWKRTDNRRNVLIVANYYQNSFCNKKIYRYIFFIVRIFFPRKIKKSINRGNILS